MSEKLSFVVLPVDESPIDSKKLKRMTKYQIDEKK